jgi:hypothetical protein
MMEAAALETRWIILGADGRHVSIGRQSDPSADEVMQAEAAMAAQGMRGWLALMKGGYYEQKKPTVIMVRSLRDPENSFDEALEAFEAKRQSTLRLTA